MIVHNPQNLPTIDYRQVKPLQGDLKDLTKDNHDKLLRVLQKRGFTTPLFLWQNEDTFFLLDGHQRQRVMTKNDLNDNGNYKVPYVTIPAKDVKEAKEQLLEITSQYGHMTIEGLEEFAADLDLADLDVNFDAIDMDKLLDSLLDEETEEDEAPEVDEVNPSVSKLGEIYQLGNHRLMCGDSVDFGSLSELMNGAQANLLLTDPPYGYKYESNHQDKHTELMNDDKILPFLPVAKDVMTDNSAAYVFCGWQTLDKWLIEIKSAKLALKNIIIWKKNNWSMGDLAGAYAGQYEIILFAHQGRVSFVTGERDSDVWEFDREPPKDHPTMKPVGLLLKAIKNSSKRGDIVLDLFGGSGSTLIACDKTDRTCYMMELDPKYCDVIRKRYAALHEAKDWISATPTIQTVEHEAH